MRLEQRFLLRAQLLFGDGQLLKGGEQPVVTISGGRTTGCIEARGTPIAGHVDGIAKPIDV